MEIQGEENLGLKDTVKAEVGKGGVKKDVTAAAKRDKALAMAQAHDKYVAAIEAARKEYVEAKHRIYPELALPSPEEQEQTIRELQEKVKLLEERLKEGPSE